MINALLVPLLAAALAQTPDPAAQALLDTAIARMGGPVTLRAVERMELDLAVEWQRQVLDARVATPVSGSERSTELRDYRMPAWRLSRRFFIPGGTFDVVNVVTDSVAAIRSNGVWRPQNVAYVDERDETFTFAPERLVVRARDAADLRALPDTTIAGARYARVAATVGRFRPTLHLRRGDGHLALARFRAAQPNDFGLAPWGEMDVDIWYSRWQQVSAAGLILPMQLDVFRVGRPYKRVTVISAKVNPAIPADSFAIADSLRGAFLATARRPMFDLPMDSARLIDGVFATFGAAGTPVGAIKVGGRWLLIESGIAPLSLERSAAFLRRVDPGTPIGGAVISAAHPGGAGGVAWLAEQRIPTWVAGAAQPFVAATRRGWKVAGATPRVADGRWIVVGTDSVRVETIDLPDHPATPVLYAPALEWVYAWPAAPMYTTTVAAHARRRGWTVKRFGSARGIAGAPAPTQRPPAAPAVQQGGATAKVDTFAITSAALRDTLTVIVRLPRGYTAQQRYPTVYTLQSGVWFERLRMPTWLDSTESAGGAPVIAVAVPDPDGLDAFRPDLPAGDAFVRFIATELVPAIESRYAARADAAGRQLLGFSAGANVLLDVAVRHPGMFSRMAAVSPGWMFRDDKGGLGSRFVDGAIASIRNAPAGASTAFWFVWGDGPSEWERQSRVYGTQVMDALRARGSTVTDAGLVAGDHGLVLARNALAGAMRFLSSP